MVVTPPFPNKKYGVIYADCPWLYDDARTHASAGMARSAYECMTMSELYALPVQRIAMPNCALCMWATRPKMREALALIETWGFTYITELFTWVKARPAWEGWPLGLDDVYAGLGHYTRANTEAVLLGRVGQLDVRDLTMRQVVVAARGAHSAKPPVVRTRIVKLFGNVPRIELFAREAVADWDNWGLEAPTTEVPKEHTIHNT